MNEPDSQPHPKENTSPDNELEIGGNVSESIVVQGDGNVIRVGDSKPPVDEERLKQLESQAVRFELKGDLYNARRTWYEIRRIDPMYPRVDIKINELEKELRLKQATNYTGGLWRSAAIVLVCSFVTFIPLLFGRWQASPSNISTPSAIVEPYRTEDRPPTPYFTSVSIMPKPTSDESFVEEFDEFPSSWSPLWVNGSANDWSPNIKNDALFFYLSSKNMGAYLLYDLQLYKDVQVTVVTESRGDYESVTSMICRYSDEGWYEFTVSSMGFYYILFKKNNNGLVVEIPLANGASSRVHPGKDINEYKSTCQGRMLSLSINGSKLQPLELRDDKFILKEGKIGIGVNSLAQAPAVVYIDQVAVTLP